MRRGALFCSRLSARRLSTPSPPRDLWWTLYTNTWFSYHIHTHTQWYFVCLLIASKHCVGVWGTICLLTKNNIHADTQTMDAKTYCRICSCTQIHTDITPECQKRTSFHLLHAWLLLSCSHSTLFHFISHHCHQMFHHVAFLLSLHTLKGSVGVFEEEE